jgi:hypothetical protein
MEGMAAKEGGGMGSGGRGEGHTFGEVYVCVAVRGRQLFQLGVDRLVN